MTATTASNTVETHAAVAAPSTRRPTPFAWFPLVATTCLTLIGLFVIGQRLRPAEGRIK